MADGVSLGTAGRNNGVGCEYLKESLGRRGSEAAEWLDGELISS